jgi:FkbM family methyltransferase
MIRRGLNFILGILPHSLQFRAGCFLSKLSKILIESCFVSKPEMEINGEQNFLASPPTKLYRVIDAGTNRGEWTTKLLKTNSLCESVVLIEPNVDLVNHLRKRFADEKRVVIIPQALDFRKDTQVLSYSKNMDTHGSLSFPKGENQDEYTSMEVKTTTLDEILNDLKWEKVDLLKLDLEGFDHNALLGARKALDEGKISVIQFEVTRNWEISGCSPCATFRYLIQHGFRLFLITEKGLRVLRKPMNIPHFSIYSNFCAIHESVSH